MGLRGPPKKPSKFKVIEGTDQPCRREPEVQLAEALTELPPPPYWLEAELELQFWNDVGPIVVRNSLLDRSNVYSFALLCRAYMRAVEDDDKGMTQYIKLAGEFGLTPVARARLKVNAVKQDEKPKGFARFSEQARAG